MADSEDSPATKRIALRTVLMLGSFLGLLLSGAVMVSLAAALGGHLVAIIVGLWLTLGGLIQLRELSDRPLELPDWRTNIPPNVGILGYYFARYLTRQGSDVAGT
jgi:hypothetical protein